MYESFRIFYDSKLDIYLIHNDLNISNEIKGQSEDYILNINETEYINYVVDKFKMHLPIIHFNDKFGEDITKKKYLIHIILMER